MVGLGSVGRRLLHLLLPVSCRTCGEALDDDRVPFFCHRCWDTIVPISGPCCPRCGRPFVSPMALRHSPQHRCGACRRTSPAYTTAWSGYPYQGPLRDAIKLFKYERKVSLANPLGDLLAHAYEPRADFDLIMPVPLHPRRLKEREFNQALLLADRLRKRFPVPVSFTNLVRRRETTPQVELERTARLKNLRQAFAVRRPADVHERRILLVDDVFTTGATVNECAKVLRKAGAADIYVATLARMP